MRIVTANVNGIRAAARKGGLTRLAEQSASVWCLQEVRAGAAHLVDVLVAEGCSDAGVVYSPGDSAGRNGVAIVSWLPLAGSRQDLPGFEGSGRWIEAVVAGPWGPVRVVSAYVPKGHAGDPRQEVKMAFLDEMDRRLRQIESAGESALVTGDLNIARTQMDLRNWRDRIGRSGFLEAERAYLDGWEARGWVDLGRALSGPGPGPYTWWSQRGRAFDNDAGWRIDYIWSTPDLAARATASEVLRAPSWDTRWSDHAPVTVTF